VLAAALLDRLTHHSHMLVFEGESHRFRESQSRKTKSQRGVNRLVNFSVDEYDGLERKIRPLKRVHRRNEEL